MIWLAALCLAALTLAPLAAFAWRGGALRGRQEAALALHRAQLTELDRDLAEGRLLQQEHGAAKLEVQRRLLADAALPDGAAAGTGGRFIGITALVVPAAALGLYLTIGHPGFPPSDRGAPIQPAGRQPSAAELAQETTAIDQLRARLKMMDPHAAKTLQGWGVLGNAELSRGHLPEAAAAWQHVLADHFDATLAAETAEVLTETADHVTPEALNLFKRAVAEAPVDAPWRAMAEKRITEGAGG